MTPLEIFLFVISLVIGYILGGLNPGYLIGRMKGIDIREVGSKNPGTSNVWHTLGKKYGIMTAAYDIFKSLISCLIAIYFLGLNYYISQFSGIIAIIGHCFPFYLKFRGGKGVAAAIGMLPYYVSMYMSTSDPLDFTMIYLVLFLLPISLLFIYITHLLSMIAWIMFPILGYASYLYYPGNEFNLIFLAVLAFLVGFVSYSAVINKKFPLKDKIFKKDWIGMILRLLSIIFLIFYDMYSKIISLILIIIYAVVIISIDFRRILREKSMKFSSISLYMVAFFITILVFPREIAFSAITFLIFGDIFRKILGLGFGRHNLLDKTVEGILAYTGCACLCVYLLYTLLAISPVILILGGITAPITVLLSIEMNDDFIMPIISGAIMYAAMLVGL
ncbi:MAG: glycerol-3-phosphate acyltransferase [Promethearchaeota archaeon]